MPEFNHLHVHTQYSLLDGAAAIPKLMEKASNDKMKALAITDHGNMFGVFNFVNEANKYTFAITVILLSATIDTISMFFIYIIISSLVSCIVSYFNLKNNIIYSINAE